MRPSSCQDSSPRMAQWGCVAWRSDRLTTSSHSHDVWAMRSSPLEMKVLLCSCTSRRAAKGPVHPRPASTRQQQQRGPPLTIPSWPQAAAPIGHVALRQLIQRPTGARNLPLRPRPWCVAHIYAPLRCRARIRGPRPFAARSAVPKRRRVGGRQFGPRRARIATVLPATRACRPSGRPVPSMHRASIAVHFADVHDATAMPGRQPPLTQ